MDIINVSLWCNYAQFMSLIGSNIKMRPQWGHIKDDIQAQGCITNTDLQLSLGPPMPYSIDDENILEAMCDSMEEGHTAVPILQYPVPAVNWAGSSSRIQFADLIGNNLYPKHGQLSIIIIRHPRFDVIWKSEAYFTECINRNYATPPEQMGYFKLLN
jgi:hypothetical protein